MRLGLLSDSHGRAAITGLAVRALLDAGADLLLHLGDVGSEAVLDELVGHPARVVFGNCDASDELARYADLVGIGVDHPAGRIEVGPATVVYTHGHLTPPMRDAVASRAAYLLHGHTHEVRDERIGSTRVINPGALFRAARYTVGVLDIALDEWNLIDLPRPT